MKFEINVELDWIENDDIDSIIKDSVVKKIVNDISEKAIKKLEVEISKKIQNQVDVEVKKEFKNIVNKKLTITDKWGDVVKEGVSLRQLVKDRFTNYMTDKVDHRGDRSDSYSNQTRANYMISNLLDKKIKEFSKDTLEQAEKKIKEYLKDSLKIKIGDSIFKTLDIENLINKKQIEK